MISQLHTFISKFTWLLYYILRTSNIEMKNHTYLGNIDP